MKYSFLIISILFSLLNVSGQDFKFGKISEENLQATQSTFEPDAPAEIIGQYTRTYFMNDINSYIQERQVRIKIYNKDKATKWLSQTINLAKRNSTTESILSFKAYTYNLVNGKIEETKLEKSNIFEEETNKYNSTYTFNFPNVQDGSIIEYKLSFSSPFIGNIDEVFFQYDIPLLYADYIMQYPEFMEYRKILDGESRPSKTLESSKKWNDRYNEKMVELVYENIPSRKKEKFVINDDNLRTGVTFELAGFTVPGYAYENYSLDWNGVFKTMRDSDGFGDQLKLSDYFVDIINPVVSDAKTKEEKAASILKYIQKEMTWNNYYSDNSNGVKKAYKDKKGNIADINLMLVDMLNAAGLNAYPVVLSSVGHGYVNPAVPTLRKFNYVIAAYTDNDEIHLLDGSNPFSSIDVLPKRALALNGFLVKSDSYQIIPIYNRALSRDYRAINGYFENGAIVGNYNHTVNNYFAIEEAENYNSNKSNYENELSEELGVKISNFDIEQEKDQLITKVTFEQEEDIENIGDKIIFNPMLFLADKEQIFNEETRTQNIEFGTPFNLSKSISIDVPEGYEVKDLPEAKAYALPEDNGVFKYSVNVKNNKILVQSNLQINAAVLIPSYYPILKEFYQKIIESETQYVSLVKNN